MAHSSKSNTLQPVHRHISKPSEDTNASGLAESAISYSAFPEPPSSIPPTPIRSIFGPPSPNPVKTHSPVSLRHASPQFTAGSIASISNRFSHSTLDCDSTRALTSQARKQRNDVNSVSASNISPYDWHEGASSIDVDATEDRLLPTSFITSLLQENAGPRVFNRASYSSDAISGISEMTYPPRNPFTDSLRDSSAILSQNGSRRQSYKAPLVRPVGGRQPNSLSYRGGPRSSQCPDPETSARAAQSGHRSDHVHSLTRDGSMISQSTLLTDQSDWSTKAGGKLPVYSEVDETDSQPDAQTNSSAGFTNSQTNLARRPLQSHSQPVTRVSVHSTRSVAPSLVSSLHSLGKRALTWRRKPLPPVPATPHISITTEHQNSHFDEQTPLPDLVNRANQLHGLLEKGHHPHRSISSDQFKSEQLNSGLEDTGSRAYIHSEGVSRLPFKRRTAQTASWLRNNKPWVVLGAFIIIAVIAIGSAVGVTARRNKIRKSSLCPEDIGGVNCNLNATCVCSSSSSQSCDKPIGRAILDVLPVMNDALSVNLTRDAVYNALWTAQGFFQDRSCLSQIELIDVGPKLDLGQEPNRTQWAQSALLWTLARTQDPDVVEKLKKLVRNAPWSQLPASDGPVSSTDSSFTVTAAGFDFNFASQTITPIPANFKDKGHPTNEQVSRIDTRVLPVLDRMYSYAIASSTQADIALLQYWTNTLHQREDRLGAFLDAFSTSPIILPLDATSSIIRSAYTLAASFPPPTACYPVLDSSQTNNIATTEGDVFGLPRVDAATQKLDPSCFPSHPTYGVLDLLRLRLPFLDSLDQAARQGIVLKSDVSPRAVVSLGKTVGSSFPWPRPRNSTQDLAVTADPRDYGTVEYASHIILQYLLSMESTNTANAVIDHVLGVASSTTLSPPNPESRPSLPLESFPTLEVAIFGNMEASDASLYVTSFVDSSGSLFFGSGDGSAFRSWAIGRGGRIAWTENATSQEVVYDDTLSDGIFNQTWLAASTAIKTNAPNVGLANITGTFRGFHRFGP